MWKVLPDRSRRHQGVTREGEEGSFGHGQQPQPQRAPAISRPLGTAPPRDGHPWMPPAGTLSAPFAQVPVHGKGLSELLTPMHTTEDEACETICATNCVFTCLLTDPGLYVFLLARPSLQRWTQASPEPLTQPLAVPKLTAEGLRVQPCLWHLWDTQGVRNGFSPNSSWKTKDKRKNGAKN